MAFTVLPDIGTLSYGKVTFDVLKHTVLHSTPVQDTAGRTVKWTEHTLTVEGVVCILANEVPVNFGPVNTDLQWLALRQQLELNGQPLMYSGRLGRIFVNSPGSPVKDVNWGPKPKILELIPLGGGLSASIRWEVTTCVMDQVQSYSTTPLIEFTYETDINYDEDWYATVTISGTMEIPLTWKNPTNLTDRTLADTVDHYRNVYLNNAPTIPDFEVKSRTFNVSKDKRHMDWSFTYAEMAPMGKPVYCTKAGGNYSIRPGTKWGFMNWTAQLNATYTVRKDMPRRYAYFGFLLLMLDRMKQTKFAILPPLAPVPANQPAQQGAQPLVPPAAAAAFAPSGFGLAAGLFASLFAQARAPGLFPAQRGAPNNAVDTRRAILTHFSVSEGLYDDSRRVTFEAGWKIFASLASILAAGGVWRGVAHLPGQINDNQNATDKTVWRANMVDGMGWEGNYDLQQDKSDDLVIDLAIAGNALPGGVPPYPPPVARA